MARATSSLPVPDSPVMSTVDLVGAALETISSTRCMFPDAATERGCKHLIELTRLAREGQVRAALFLLVQRPDGASFAPAAVVDPRYAALLATAQASGVLVLPYRARVTPERITLAERLPLSPCLAAIP